SWAHGIDDEGTVVGWSETASGERHALLWEDDQMRDLGTLGGKESRAYAINPAGQIVGYADDAEGRRRACLWSDGRALDLGGDSTLESQASAINACGEVVGDYYTGQAWHAFLYREGRMIDLHQCVPRLGDW